MLQSWETETQMTATFSPSNAWHRSRRRGNSGPPRGRGARPYLAVALGVPLALLTVLPGCGGASTPPGNANGGAAAAEQSPLADDSGSRAPVDGNDAVSNPISAKYDGPAGPNIIVYLIDTLRADDLGCYGNKVVKTPAIDRLAAEGTLFENASTLAPLTRPAIASLITGVAPYIHGVVNHGKFLNEEATKSLARLPSMLQARGYYTAAIVGNPNIASVFGFTKGFDLYKELHTPQAGDDIPNWEDMIADSEKVVNETIAFLKEAPADNPYFLFVLVIDPHAPYTPPAPYETMYDPQANGQRDASVPVLLEINKRLAAGESPSMDRIRALYRGAVSYADAQFGRLLDWMRETQRLDDTFLVFSSDHGEAFNEHGNRAHGKTLYEEVMHIPLIIRYPRLIEAGRRRSDAVDLLDISTTLLRTGGAKRPSYWVGRDLRAPQIRPRPIFSMTVTRKWKYTTARVHGWKMILNEQTAASEFYYLPDDPAERSPLSGEKAARAKRLLSERLAAFKTVAVARHKQMIDGDLKVSKEDLPKHVQRGITAIGYVDDPDDR